LLQKEKKLANKPASFICFFLDTFQIVYVAGPVISAGQRRHTSSPEKQKERLMGKLMNTLGMAFGSLLA
jgi:hypothetical protein